MKQFINGYLSTELDQHLFSRMAEFTGSSIRARVQKVNAALGSPLPPIFLSIGENCGPAIKIRQAGLTAFGGSFFDNLVAPIESTIRLLDEDFRNLLQPGNLVIGRWENNDSVLDMRYNIFFHHYFYLRGPNEKDDFSGGVRRRLIDEADIPLFLPAVIAQFEYLAAKFRLVLRSSHRKILAFRKVDGNPLPIDLLYRLNSALERFGANNYSIRIIHSEPFQAGRSYSMVSHHLILEASERWGAAENWQELRND